MYKIVPSDTLSNRKNKGQGSGTYTLFKVAVLLGVSVDRFLTGKESSNGDFCPIRRVNAWISPTRLFLVKNVG